VLLLGEGIGLCVVRAWNVAGVEIRTRRDSRSSMTELQPWALYSHDCRRAGKSSMETYVVGADIPTMLLRLIRNTVDQIHIFCEGFSNRVPLGLAPAFWGLCIFILLFGIRRWYPSTGWTRLASSGGHMSSCAVIHKFDEGTVQWSPTNTVEGGSIQKLAAINNKREMRGRVSLHEALLTSLLRLSLYAFRPCRGLTATAAVKLQIPSLVVSYRVLPSFIIP